MHKPHPQFWKDFLLKAFLLFNSRLGFLVLAGFYERIDDESLVTKLHLIANAVVNPFAFGRKCDAGGDRNAPLRHFVHYAHIQAAKNGQLE